MNKCTQYCSSKIRLFTTEILNFTNNLERNTVRCLPLVPVLRSRELPAPGASSKRRCTHEWGLKTRLKLPLPPGNNHSVPLW